MIFGSDYINRLICHLEKLKAMKLDLEMELQSVQATKTTGVSTTYFAVLKEAHLHTSFTPTMSNAKWAKGLFLKTELILVLLWFFWSVQVGNSSYSVWHEPDTCAYY